MKYYPFLILLLFIACNKNKNEFKYYGTASAMFNGNSWKATKVMCGIATQCYKGKLYFRFEVYNDHQELRESLVFSNIPLAKGMYIIYPANFGAQQDCNKNEAFSSYITSQADGDVILDSYDALPSAANYFTIEDYNERTKKLSGSFSVTYKIFSRSLTPHTSPDTIKVTNGRFDTKILE